MDGSRAVAKAPHIMRGNACWETPTGAVAGDEAYSPELGAPISIAPLPSVRHTKVAEYRHCGLKPVFPPKFQAQTFVVDDPFNAASVKYRQPTHEATQSTRKREPIHAKVTTKWPHTTCKTRRDRHRNHTGVSPILVFFSFPPRTSQNPQQTAGL